MNRRVDMVSRVLIVGVNPYVDVSAERATMLRPGWRKPLPVLVRINEGPATPWRTNLIPTGDGSFRLYLHGAMRSTANVGIGDVVRVGLEVDNDYHSNPAHPMPPWFQAALDADSVIRNNWLKLFPQSAQGSGALPRGTEVPRRTRTKFTASTQCAEGRARAIPWARLGQRSIADRSAHLRLNNPPGTRA